MIGFKFVCLDSFRRQDTQRKRDACPIECTEISFDYKLTEARYRTPNRWVPKADPKDRYTLRIRNTALISVDSCRELQIKQFFAWVFIIHCLFQGVKDFAQMPSIRRKLKPTTVMRYKAVFVEGRTYLTSCTTGRNALFLTSWS